jgi:polyhydroxyalkanoate synthesis repressor PhaR
MPGKAIIKKYSNRRLYDTEKNRYITLQQVADLIKEGRQVEVIDAKSNDDVTSYILTQVILEGARKKNFLLPVPLLHLFIRYGETILSEFFEKYLHQVIKNYLMYKSTVDEQFANWLNLTVNLAGGKPPSESASLQTLFDIFKPPVTESQTHGERRENPPEGEAKDSPSEDSA